MTPAPFPQTNAGRAAEQGGGRGAAGGGGGAVYVGDGAHLQDAGQDRGGSTHPRHSQVTLWGGHSQVRQILVSHHPTVTRAIAAAGIIILIMKYS